jgi:hypothetical protein
MIVADDDPEGSYRAISIIGWMHTQGSNVVPLTAQPHVALGHGVAYLIPHGIYSPNTYVVSDPTHKRTFDGEDVILDWLEFIHTHTDADAPRIAANDVGGLNVAFYGSRTYTKTSWWHFKDGDTEFVFALDGGQPMPDDARVKKITRDAFARLKKTVEVIPLDTLLNPPEPEAVADDLDEEAEDLV